VRKLIGFPKAAWLAITRKPLQWLSYLLFAAFFLHADLFAGIVFIVASQIIRYLLVNRSEHAFRRSLISLVAVIGVLGFVAALGMPTYRATRDNLIIPAQSIREGGFSAKPGSFEFTADLMTTSPDAQAQIDSQARYLTALGMDGYFLNSDGSLQATDNTLLLLHTHIADTRGMFLVQNYTANAAGQGAFDPKTAQAVLSDPAKRTTLVDSIIDQAVAQHWDGVIMDFEGLSDSGLAKYAQLLDEIKAKLPSGMQLGVDLQVLHSSPSATYLAAFQQLGQAADFVNLMTYDLHVSSGASGPIGPLAWVKSQVQAAEQYIAPQKIRLGVAAYADVWGPLAKKIGAVLAPAEALKYAATNHLTTTWDPVIGEWHVTRPDGSEMWIQDRQSLQARIRLAQQMGIRGVNMWELSRSQNLSGATAGIAIYRPYVATRFSRPIHMFNGKGLVALTFDDGPDPTWTPKILSVLEKLHVPATFFVIGQQAVDHPDLVARALRDGDVIGNHTYTHPDLASLPQWMAQAEINAGSWVIKGITGMQPLLFRSPYGIADTLTRGKFSASADLAQTMGLQEIGWNTDTLDWSRPGVAKIVANAAAAPNAEPIILMHDGGGNRAESIAALPKIVAHYRALGYQFTTVDHLDGGVSYPYLVQKENFWGLADSLTSIAGFKLWLAARDITGTVLILMAAISLLRLSAGWALAARYLRRNSKRISTDARPLVSVLIPAHNEQETIVKTLTSMAKLDYPNLEVIVAENGSTDETLKRAAEFAAGDGRVVVMKCDARGKAGALNEAFAKSRGEVIVVLDADTVISPNFCSAVVGHFANPEVGAVAGNVKVGNRRNLLTRLQALEYIFSLSLDRASQAQVGIVSVVPGAAGAFRREAILATGGWPDRTLVEDTDLTVQLHRSGWKIEYEPAAVSLTESPETVREVIKQRSRWIYGTTQVVSANMDAVLNLQEGRLGLAALPWLLITQVLLPVLGPLVDLYLISQFLLGQSLVALGTLALSLVLEAAVTVWALRQAGESMRLLPGVIGLRLIWRPLMLWVALVSMTRFLRGRAVFWRSLTRKNSVQVAG
jgi:peptidoglycan-N-acetylglucosamine deacetylase